MRRNLFVSFGVVTVAFLIILVSCRKINMATDVGQGLIPEVDNVHTFDTTIEVLTYNHLFTSANDTFNTVRSDEQFLGLIENDPIFGKTDARMYFQIIPRQSLRNVPSKRYLDSVVLYVDYVETYGDSTIPQTIQVSEIRPTYDFKFIINRDSSDAYSIRSNNIDVFSNVLATKSIIPSTLDDSIYYWQDSLVKTANVLSIKLDNSLGERLLSLDSASIVNDTLFKQNFNGFALRSTNGGNAVLGLSLLSERTRVAVFYKYESTSNADLDTTVANFALASTSAAAANYVGRNYSGTQMAASVGDNIADQFVYIQNTPGAYALLKIPALAGMSNRIVHLAELQAEAIADPSDQLFYPPKLFIDAYDNTSNINYNLPFVFNDFLSSGTISELGLFAFGYDSISKNNGSNTVTAWNFNVTRYVQNIVNGKRRATDLRLYAKPLFNIVDTLEYNSDNGYVKVAQPLEVHTVQSRSPNVSTEVVSPLVGRVRLGGGSHPTQRMKLRIVYSKI